MTTQKLIKSLRSCANGSGKACIKCAFYEFTAKCVSNMINAAADRLKQLEAERNKAVEDLTEVLKGNSDRCICDYCKYYQPCKGKNCELYQEGKGGTINGVEHPEIKWDCRDFDICEKLKNTPCDGCDYEKHFQWCGVG